MADSLFDLDLPDDEDRVKFTSAPSSRTASQAPLAVRMRPRHECFLKTEDESGV